MAGHFDTMLGNEVINPADNPNITRSFLFGYTINFQNTGVRAMYEPGVELFDEIYIGVGNGWDTIYDEGENQEKTFEAAFGSSLGSASLFVAMNYGEETDGLIRQTYTAVLRRLFRFWGHLLRARGIRATSEAPLAYLFCPGHSCTVARHVLGQLAQ